MIPNVIHFVYGLEPDFGGKDFSFAHWAAITSARKLHPDFRILFWHRHLPDNHYFDDVRDSIELMPVEPPASIFGNPLLHVAHKTDVLRLRALLEYGGIYLDIDTITVQSFLPLLDSKCVMGYEAIGDDPPRGLCNAVVVAEPQSRFLKAWLESFRSFRSKGRDQYWAEHAVEIPLKLASQMPDEITVLPKEAFFWPDWTPLGLQQMFVRNETFDKAFAHHLWETFSWGALKSINEFNYRYFNCTYANLLKQIVGDEIQRLAARRHAWVQRELDGRAARLNLGCGPNRDISQINCDVFPQSGADLVFDLTSPSWPLPSDSASKVVLSHVLEHLPANLDSFFRELYRVTRDGAQVLIKVPHPRHDWFLMDPTHVKAWHEQSFAFLDKAICLGWYFSGDSKTPLALYWDIDFKVESIMMVTESAEIDSRVIKAFGPTVNIEQARTFLNNYAAEIQVTLRTRKSL